MDVSGDVVTNIFRSFENLNVTKDVVSLYFSFEALRTDGLGFRFSSKIALMKLKLKLGLEFYKYLFSPKISKGWQSE